jgi:hypothetical protein
MGSSMFAGGKGGGQAGKQKSDGSNDGFHGKSPFYGY